MDDVREENFSTALLARGRRLVIIGAVLLWVVSPLLIGAWVTVAAKLADRGGVSALLYAGMVVWALACLVALLSGFAMLLGGVFFWWRSRTVAQVPSERRAPSRGAASGSARADLLRQMQQDLREDAHQDAGDGRDRDVHATDVDRVDVAAEDDVENMDRGDIEPHRPLVEPHDSETPHARR